jgi:hypothetical protein
VIVGATMPDYFEGSKFEISELALAWASGPRLLLPVLIGV